MKMKNAVEFVKNNYEKVGEILESGMETGVCDEEVLYENFVITKAEYIAIKEENIEVYEKVMAGLRYVHNQLAINSGCVLCNGCYGCSEKRKRATKVITVSKEKWLGAIGAGGGSAEGTVEIPEVCAREIARGLSVSFKNYVEYMS